MKVRAFKGTACAVVFFDEPVAGSARMAHVKPVENPQTRVLHPSSSDDTGLSRSASHPAGTHLAEDTCVDSLSVLPFEDAGARLARQRGVMDARTSGASRRVHSAPRLRLPSLADEAPCRSVAGGQAENDRRALLGEGRVAIHASAASGEGRAGEYTPASPGDGCAAWGTPVLGKTAAVSPAASVTRRMGRAASVLMIGALCLALAHANADAAERRSMRQTPADMRQPEMSLSWQLPSAAALRELMAEAEQHYRQKRDDEALSIFSSLIELSPEHRAEALLRVGNIRQRNGSPGEAVDVYRQLLAMQPVDVPQEAGRRKAGNSGVRQVQVDAGHAQRLQAARLKALINLSVMSLEQGREALAQLRTMPQDPALWQAAGMNEQMTQALADNLLSQVAQIQQMLAGETRAMTAGSAASSGATEISGMAGVPGSSGTSGTPVEPGMSGTVNPASGWGLETSGPQAGGRPTASGLRGSARANGTGTDGRNHRVMTEGLDARHSDSAGSGVTGYGAKRHRYAHHPASTPDLIIGRSQATGNAADMNTKSEQVPAQAQASAVRSGTPEAADFLRPVTLTPASGDGDAPGKPLVEYRIKPGAGIPAARQN